MDAVLGLKLAESVEAYFSAKGNVSKEENAEVEKLIAERADAKKAKDFARADAIRDELKGRGIILEDSAAGTTWKYV
jgi:cysteinyl-tRNA synthetase